MSAVLDTLLRGKQVWRGRPAGKEVGKQPTGWAKLDAALPGGGWPEAALSEILLATHGVGELTLVLPTLARLTGRGERIVVVAPPCIPYAPAWRAAGVDLRQLCVVRASAGERAWALEQCLRSGSCGAVLGWLDRADNRTLRRLQVAADSGKALGFVFRDTAALGNPSPAPLRVEVTPGVLHVHKCRGGQPPAPFAFPAESPAA